MSNSLEFSQPYSLPSRGRDGEDAVFNSKLLLFGEYGLMYGAMALATPFSVFNGQLAFDTEGQYPESTEEIRKLVAHLKANGSEQNLHFPLDLDQLEADLENRLCFYSAIPQQYGLGSSGALVAALFSKYAFPAEMGNNLSPEILKANFAVLESYFHGRSSGLDPLISYLNKPLLIDSQKQIVTVDFDYRESGIAIALIDTHTTGATGPLVQHFIDLFNLPEFEQAFRNQFVPANNGCIESLLKGDKTSFFLNLEQLVRFEVYHFHEMIPVHFHKLISHALCSKVYIKLLGSGGGGFLLAMANNTAELEKISNKYGLSMTLI